MATDRLNSVLLREIADAGYVFERAEVRPGLILYRARPTEEGVRSGLALLVAEGSTDDEAIERLYAAFEGV